MYNSFEAEIWPSLAYTRFISEVLWLLQQLWVMLLGKEKGLETEQVWETALGETCLFTERRLPCKAWETNL